ncbi:hypothetical protein GPSY_3529 [Paraglaciecola psychrophila 170]|nr:hypothetical protein GPSY_3529 [Paraglaciecola psychrophila 170]
MWEMHDESSLSNITHKKAYRKISFFFVALPQTNELNLDQVCHAWCI